MMVQNTKKCVLVTYVDSILDIYKEFEQTIRAKGNGAIPIVKFIQTYV